MIIYVEYCPCGCVETEDWDPSKGPCPSQTRHESDCPNHQNRVADICPQCGDDAPLPGSLCASCETDLYCPNWGLNPNAGLDR